MQPSSFDGTSDSGGGNGINGRPLESYRINILERAEYKSFLASLVDRTEAETKVLHNRLLYVLKKKNWYLVPVALGELPAAKIGTSFKADQIALQNFDEIWIDQKKFEAMTSDEERAKLLFHEVVMGLKILAFESELKNCLAVVDAVRSTDTETLQTCEPYKRKDRRELNFSQQDYADIRSVTEGVFARRDSIKATEFTEALKYRNFDAWLVSYSVQQDSKHLSSQEILNLISSNAETQTLPTFSGFDNDKAATEKCTLTWQYPDAKSVSGGVLKLKAVLSDSTTGQTKRTDNLSFDLPDDKTPFEAYSGLRIGSKTLNTIELWTTRDASTQGGYTLNIDFEEEQIRSVRIFKFTYAPIVKPSCDTCSGGGRVSKFMNPRLPENEPIFCYSEQKLPQEFDLYSTVQDQ